MIATLTLLLLGHGTYSTAYQPDELPNSPRHLAVGTSFGLLVSNDDGGSWSWICDEAIGYGQGLYPTWHFTPNGEILTGSFRGLFRSNDRGCTWTSHPDFAELPDGGQGTGAADIRSNGTFLFATTSKYGVVNTVKRSLDQGLTWTPTSVASAGEFFPTVRIAPSRPQRVYVSGWWFRPLATAYLYWSDDSGDTFTRVDVTDAMPMGTIGDGGTGRVRGAFYVYEVDPNDPDTIYGVLQQDDPPRHSFVVRSRDRGTSWAPLLDSVDQVTGVVLSADGNTIWVATATKVLRSTDTGATFTHVKGASRYTCVSRFEDRVYVCGWYEVDGFAVARSTGADTFEPVLTWNRVTGVANCPGTAVESVCGPLFSPLVASFPKRQGEEQPPPQDGGVITNPPVDAPGSRCGCTLAPELGVLALASLGLARRRRALTARRSTANP